MRIFLCYLLSDKAFRVCNKRITIIEKIVHISFDKSNNKMLRRDIVHDVAEDLANTLNYIIIWSIHKVISYMK